MLHRLCAALLMLSLFPACMHHRENQEIVISDNPWGQPPIGIAWICGAVMWTEALLERRMQVKKNYSESYLLYRHFESQIVAGKKKLDASGSFVRARDLITWHGLIEDDIFLPNLTDQQRLQRNADAMAYLNDSLSSGALSKGKSSAVIQDELTKAFQLKESMTVLKSKILWPTAMKVGQTLTLARELERAEELKMDNRVIPAPKDLVNGKPYSQTDLKFMRRVMRNFKQNYPVLVAWTADFNGMTAGTFSLETFKNGPGKQVMQWGVIEALAAEGPDQKGGAFILKEDQKDAVIIDQAIKAGEMTALLIRNNWLGSESPTKSGNFSHKGVRVSRLMANYAFGYFPENVNDKKTGKAIRGIKSVIVAKNI